MGNLPKMIRGWWNRHPREIAPQGTSGAKLSFVLESCDTDVRIFLRGEINRSAGPVLDQVLKSIQDSAIVFLNFHMVQGIDSLGEGPWLWFVRRAAGRHTLVLEDLTPDVVRYLNLSGRFQQHCRILSFLADYFCPPCDAEYRHVYRTGSGPEEIGRDHRRQACTSCGGRLMLDGNAEEYFAFLGRQNSQAIPPSISSRDHPADSSEDD